MDLEGFKFGEPTEAHQGPLVRRPTAPGAPAAAGQDFTDRVLDTYDLQELLDLRNRIEKRLPARSLKDINLEQELVLQVRALQELQAKVLQSDDTPANQMAQVGNSLSAALANLVKVQADVYTSERLKRLESVVLEIFQSAPEEVMRQAVDRYCQALEAFDP
jgi:hypothetical protein